MKTQMTHLFSSTSDQSAAKPLGRYCSLNLMALLKYGTLEFRRFHGTLNPHTLCCWTAFCVGFVECFHSHEAAASAVFDVPLDQGLSALRAAQEHASLEELVRLMAHHVDQSVIQHLIHDCHGDAS